MRLGGPVAVCHHGVGRPTAEEDPVELVVAPEHLESQVRLLQRLGYTFLTAGELLTRTGGAAPSGRVAVLTFDDGWLDGLTITAPLLERLGVRATFYVCPGWFGLGQHPLVHGEPGRLLDAAATRELHERGMEVASHAMDHPDLRLLADGELDDQLRGSKALVEEVTGEPCRTLAYPYGLHDDRVERAAAGAGYQLAWAWEPRPWRALAAPRIPGPPRNGGGRLGLKLAGVRIPNRVHARLAALRRR